MDNDSGVKAPVTRLRRRLSVEADETKSPSTPSTPTKKRGRLAVKPQLDLIDENVQQDTPKKVTRKSVARDAIEEEKPLTPARRSTRTKSNTSIISENPQDDEKSVTPARRSTRIKSNTSILSESIQVLDSPRAKRATARRNSQIDSDTETSVTPARVRRTRKDSAGVDIATPGWAEIPSPARSRSRQTRKNSTSSDTQVTPDVAETAPVTRKRRSLKGSASNDTQDVLATGKPTSLIEEVISEEPESSLRKSIPKSESDNISNENVSPTAVRKSPRLAKKISDSCCKGEDDNNTNDSNKISGKSTPASSEEVFSAPNLSNTPREAKLSESKITKTPISESKEKTLKEQAINKNTSIIEETESKRHRTQSWNNSYRHDSINESSFHSDNEEVKKKMKKRAKTITKIQAAPGDQDQKSKETVGNKQNSSLNSDTTEQKKEDISIFSELKQFTATNELDKENYNVSTLMKNVSATEILFETSPEEIKTRVFVDDSDSNSDNVDKVEKAPIYYGGDQCVPVVYQPLNQETPNRSQEDLNKHEGNLNNSCEPMDIDETIPENLSLIDSPKDSKEEDEQNKDLGKQLKQSSRKSSLNMPQETANQSLDESKDSKEEDEQNKYLGKQMKKSSRKSSLNMPQETANPSLDESKDIKEEDEQNKDLGKQLKKSLRKSTLNMLQDTANQSLDKSKQQELEQSSNENKSTLVLSQIKDVSIAEDSITKSPKVPNDLSKSVNIHETAINKNISVNYLTSTPVTQKENTKRGLQMNSSVITPNNKSKDNNEFGQKRASKQNESMVSKSSQNSSSEESENDDSNKRSNLLDDEAEDAGDDYESGDSQDDNERQYRKDNEIVEKGETLTSEDEVSDDSDYEKDSFIVSSDGEDENLLSGSGDDLDMSDNELTFTAKSKNKFNERKKKEQKKASREMYEARHSLDKSGRSGTDTKEPKKKNRLRLDSTLLESEDDDMNKLPPKKNKRMRLESTLETSSDNNLDTRKQDNQTPKLDNKEIGHKKKKSKRLSESTHSESMIVHEKELSICNQNTTLTEDPLLSKVKQEPKTPLKELEISTVQFTCREEIEEVQVDENASILKPNDTLDPLQVTLAQNGSDEDDDDDDDQSSISENEEIAQNYDSMLKELNKGNKERQQGHGQNMSLNFNKKTKQIKEPLIEELNLTITEKSKKKRNNTETDNEKTVKRVFKKLNNENENSMDSIDFKLLFSDDSNGANEDEKKNTGEVLMNTGDQTNISKTEIVKSGKDASTKKNKKRKAVVEDIETGDINADENEVMFFIDTTGNRSDSDLNESHKTTKNALSQTKDENADDVAPAEVSYKSEKIKERTKKLSENVAEDSHLNKSLKTPRSEKKKKHRLENEIIEITHKEPSPHHEKKNKKKQNALESQTEESELFTVPSNSAEISLNKPGSDKKKKKKACETELNHLLGNENIEITDDQPSSCKKKKKKKNMHNESKSQTEESELFTVPGDSADISLNKPVSEETKTKKKKAREAESSIELVPGTINVSLTNNKRTECKEAIAPALNDKETDLVDVVKSSSKKRKRKSSNQYNEVTTTQQNAQNMNTSMTKEIPAESMTAEHKKKKRKIVVEETENITKINNKKRKNCDEDNYSKEPKVRGADSFENTNIPRLPDSIISQLEDKPVEVETKKRKVVSTANFTVEGIVKRKNKPSRFLEESVYLNNDDIFSKKSNVKAKKPKVLPFVPTVCTSYTGFTTNFQVTVLPKKIEFVAQPSQVPDFKTDHVNRKIKKLRTYNSLKRIRNMKLSKY